MSDNDFAYAYWVEDLVDGIPVRGVNTGVYDLLSGAPVDAVISLKAARRLGEQILAICDAMESG
jgi:hypothetical protein